MTPEPPPADEPDEEPSDSHRPPLDDESDAEWLEPDDPRRARGEEAD